MKDIILNVIERYDLKCYWMIWCEILLNNMILNIIKYIFKIYPRLISSLSFVNKSLMISMFSFSTAKYNAVL